MVKASRSPKSYQLSFEHRPEYLYGHVEGDEDSLEISRQYWEEVSAECQRTGQTRVLIEEDLQGQVRAWEAFEVACLVPQLGFKGAKIAFVDNFRYEKEINDFIRSVSVNRGLNVNIFDNVEQAERWLLAD